MRSTDSPSAGRGNPDGPAAGSATRERTGSGAGRVASAPRISWLTPALMTTGSVAGPRSAPTVRGTVRR
ncbi:hypothetical protein ACGF12_23200 [Kitasatospora sp. NPDC048296]|uniref:hypothetical protein n=1 Tax=Kitasatospora sp. NPDC048296 TaxID=3364048 RepID=UPI0037244C1F